ncbi:hypothetical protein MtrunA17_Chr5g0418641 [Medicago truncatula]|uniref:Uncharacterized protein n=1 Tax=Medicago truncatula TaxID=3880 RepID=A0A396HSP3_MEDTR|nr:hypothetical protein MtrunA17_Chr5g0418641 [Medicago truncatula]
MRVQLTGKEENKADFGATRDRKIPMQKTQSFKAEKKKGQSWLQKQLSSKTGRDCDYIDMVHGAAVAAAAFSINLQ